MDYEYVPAPAAPGIYEPDALILYGVKLNSSTDYGAFSIGQGGYELRAQLFREDKSSPTYSALTSQNYSIVLAYGYSFEGHCYRFDSQRIFLVINRSDENPVGCGFDLEQPVAPAVRRYRMWRIRAATELLEIATTAGDAKTLILDANLPGRRSPNSYAIHSTTAHRNGRMTRD